eukprot:jgi/Picre1/27327/NNA_000296.t1
MISEGCPFRGVLFAGLMIKDGKAKLLEHNVRFGDPECQSLMVRMKSDLFQTLDAALKGVSDIDLEWDPNPSLTVVIAAKGYPGSYAKGSVIEGLDAVQGQSLPRRNRFKRWKGCLDWWSSVRSDRHRKHCG